MRIFKSTLILPLMAFAFSSGLVAKPTGPLGINEKKEFSPEQFDFTSSVTQTSYENQKLSLTLAIKVGGEDKKITFFDGKVANIPESEFVKMKVQWRRLTQEAEGVVESLKQERRTAFLNSEALVFKPEECKEKNKYEKNANRFFKDFLSSEAFKANERIRGHHFHGPKLSDPDFKQQLQMLEDASITAKEKSFDLGGYFNCIDDTWIWVRGSTASSSRSS